MWAAMRRGYHQPYRNGEDKIRGKTPQRMPKNLRRKIRLDIHFILSRKTLTKNR